MTGWPLKHRALCVAVLIAATIAGVCYVYLIRPLQQDVTGMDQTVEASVKRLRQNGWPADYRKLNTILERKTSELANLNLQTDRILSLARGAFADRIKDKFEVKSNFLNHVSRLDFQEFYVELQQKLARENIVLDEEVLRLGENSVSPHVYQLVLQLWTLERIMQLGLENGVTPVKVPISVPVAAAALDATGAATGEPRQETRYVSNVTMRPVRGYFLSEADDEGPPYVLEIPVFMTARCSTAELCDFLTSLHNAEEFIPVNQIQVRKQPPFRQQRTPDLLRVDIECSIFFRISDRAVEVPVRTTVAPLPHGA